MKKVALLVVMFIGFHFLFAGPFGLEFGWTINQMKESGVRIGESKREVFVTMSAIEPRKKHVELDNYITTVDDEKGLVHMRAYTDGLFSESEIRNTYNILKGQLSFVYGWDNEIEIDKIDWNSNLHGPENFIRSIFHGDRKLLSFWEMEPTEENPLWMIIISVYADSDSVAYIAVDYFSRDIENTMKNYYEMGAAVLQHKKKDYGIRYFLKKKKNIGLFDKEIESNSFSCYEF